MSLVCCVDSQPEASETLLESGTPNLRLINNNTTRVPIGGWGGCYCTAMLGEEGGESLTATVQANGQADFAYVVVRDHPWRW
jgi:hypothetical protein